MPEAANRASRAREGLWAPWNPWNLVVYLGVLLALIAALGLYWVNVRVSLFFRIDLFFRLLDNATLTAITMILLAATLILMHFRRIRGWAVVGGGAGCLAIMGIYIYAMVAKAFNILGALRDIPIIGQPLNELARNITSVYPAAGFIIFVIGTLLILGCGIFMVRGERARRRGKGIPDHG